MNQLGLGVMISMMKGNAETVAALALAKGKTIETIRINENDVLRVGFAEGGTLVLYDDGQSCCEARYMRTDEDLNYYVGAKLLDVSIKDGGTNDDEYDDVHEIEFLILSTDRGEIDFVNHNEHNGYYGGFNVVAEWRA